MPVHPWSMAQYDLLCPAPSNRMLFLETQAFPQGCHPLRENRESAGLRRVRSCRFHRPNDPRQNSGVQTTIEAKAPPRSSTSTRSSQLRRRAHHLGQGRPAVPVSPQGRKRHSTIEIKAPPSSTHAARRHSVAARQHASERLRSLSHHQSQPTRQCRDSSCHPIDDAVPLREFPHASQPLP